jgi:hypothetical protein
VDNRQKPNVVARASQTVTINESGNIVGSSGTSFSSPLIAGAAACLMQAFPNLTPQQIRSAIEASASQSNNPDNLLGFGIPDFGVAFTTLGGELVEPVLEDIIVSHNQDGVLIQSPAKTQIGNFDIYSTTGQLVMRKRSSSNRFQLANGTLKSGIYLIKFERTAKIFKIIMQ